MSGACKCRSPGRWSYQRSPKSLRGGKREGEGKEKGKKKRKKKGDTTFRRHLKTFLLSVGLVYFSCPLCLKYLCSRALILLRLRRYINHVLTYLLTYLKGRNKTAHSQINFWLRPCSRHSIRKSRESNCGLRLDQTD